MKYSFMSFSTPELDLADTLTIARKYGYDGIEPRLECNHLHGIETDTTLQQRESIKAQIAASGIKLACIATSLTYADPDKTFDMIKQTHECIDLAGDLGAPAIRVFGGSIPEGYAREKAIDLLVSSFVQVADHASERGVTVCMETHDDWCDPANVAAVISRVNNSAIAVNWDIMHPVLTGGVTMDYAFQTLKPWIRHLHIHDGSKAYYNLLPIGTGDIDHHRALELLKTIGYNGYISGEWIGWEPYDIHLPRELATMKQYEKELI